MIYFVALLTEKIFGFPDKMGVFSYLYTGLVVLFAWVVFRAENISSAMHYLGNMLGIGANGLWDISFVEEIAGDFTILLCAIVGATPIFRKCCTFLKSKKLDWLEQVWLLVVFVLSIISVVASSYNPFIYFNF